jgi:antitoxin HigA-1
MSTKLKSRTTTSRQAEGEFVARRLPRHRPPTHPGQMLYDEFLVPLGITQSELAAQLRVSFPRLNEIVRGKRGVTPDTALRLARVVGMSADFWLGLQQDWDLWHAIHSNQAAEIKRLKPLDRTGKGKTARENEG